MRSDKLTLFTAYRPLLFHLAYRMVGSVMDAEDMVQETFLRWQGDATEPENPKAYLATIVTRLCLDFLRSARVQRESYIGPWLPEPLVWESALEGYEALVQGETLSLAFLLLLEKLNPLERAVFLLREVFAFEYGEIGQMVERSEANCRQIFHRAKGAIQEARPRYTATPEQHQLITGQFVQACLTGDLSGLLNLLSEDITLWADGGGKVRAAQNLLQGADRVARYLLGIMKRLPEGFAGRFVMVNGQVGLAGFNEGKPFSVTNVVVAEGKIQAIHIILNPDKLQYVEGVRLAVGKLS